MLKRKATISVLITLVLLTAACSDSQLRRAAVFMRDFAVGLESTQLAEIEAHKASYVSDADHKQIQAGIQRVAELGKEVNDAIRIAKSKVQAIEKIDLALQQLDAVLQKGMLGIKNDQSRAGFSALILSVRGVLIGAKAALS